MYVQNQITGASRAIVRAALLSSCATLALAAHAQIPMKIYAQHLVDEVVAKTPDVLVVVMHVTPPQSADNVIVASNIGRIGKKADEDDLRVIRTGKTNLEVAAGGKRLEVELVLRDVSGDAIGALGVVFPYKEGDDQSALKARAEKIRDSLKRRITYVSNLMEPYPMDPRATTKTHAQKLVDEVIANNPDLLILALHVTPPGWKDNIIIASNIGRIGKKADADDLQVLTTGKSVVRPHGNGNRFHVELVLEDASGQPIGALGIVFPYKVGDAEASFVARAEQLRNELRGRIPSIEKLLELDP